MCVTVWGEGYWIVWNLSHEFPLLSDIFSNHKEKGELWLCLFFLSLNSFKWEEYPSFPLSPTLVCSFCTWHNFMGLLLADVHLLSAISSSVIILIYCVFCTTVFIKWISLKVVMANPLERTVISAFCFMYTAVRSVFIATFSSWKALGQE